jgi:uncharacterized membrane protein YdbT with pleckstrin-like domain
VVFQAGLCQGLRGVGASGARVVNGEERRRKKKKKKKKKEEEEEEEEEEEGRRRREEEEERRICPEGVFFLSGLYTGTLYSSLTLFTVLFFLAFRYFYYFFTF